jgi:hypothetical protein
MFLSLLSIFGLGFLYFISAIPVAAAAGLPLGVALVVAWLGYSSGALVVLLLGTPFRLWLVKKFHLSWTPDPKKLFWKIWNRYGLLGLGLIAPVTMGPQLAALFLLTLGEGPKKIILSLSLGALPWAFGFAGVIKFGLHAVQPHALFSLL